MPTTAARAIDKKPLAASLAGVQPADPASGALATPAWFIDASVRGRCSASASTVSGAGGLTQRSKALIRFLTGFGTR